MLSALGKQLKLLAADPRNNFSSIIRQLTGPREAARYGQPLRRMILALPEMIAQLRSWSGRSGLPPRVRRMQAFTLSYLYDPIDFLSAKSPGLFRYLDDAYLIARIYQITLAKHGTADIKGQGSERNLANDVSQWITLTRRILPKETAKIEALLDEAARKRIDQTTAGPRRLSRRKRSRVLRPQNRG